jgi:anti-sigma B factor antagonist
MRWFHFSFAAGAMTTFTESDVDGVTVLRLSGSLGQEGAEAVGPQFGAAVHRAGRVVVIDLSAVKVLNTPGIGMLLKAHRELQADGKRLILAGPNGIVADVLRCCQFHRIMSIVDNEAAAIELARAGGGGGGGGGGGAI